MQGQRKCKICGELREAFDYRDEQSQGCLFCEDQGLSICHTCGNIRSVENFGFYDTLDESGGLATCELCKLENRRKCFTCGEVLPLDSYKRGHKTCISCIKAEQSYSGKRRCRVCGEVKNVRSGYAGKASETCMACREQQLRDEGEWKSGLGTYETIDDKGLPITVEKITKRTHVINGVETGYCVHCGQVLSLKANFQRSVATVLNRRKKFINGEIKTLGTMSINVCDDCARAANRKGFVLQGKFCDVCRSWHPLEHFRAINAKGEEYTHTTCMVCRDAELKRCRECGEVLHVQYFRKVNRNRNSYSTLCNECRARLK